MLLPLRYNINPALNGGSGLYTVRNLSALPPGMLEGFSAPLSVMCYSLPTCHSLALPFHSLHMKPKRPRAERRYGAFIWHSGEEWQVRDSTWRVGQDERIHFWQTGPLFHRLYYQCARQGKIRLSGSAAARRRVGVGKGREIVIRRKAVKGRGETKEECVSSRSLTFKSSGAGLDFSSLMFGCGLR